MKLALSLPGLSGTPMQILGPSSIPTGGFGTGGGLENMVQFFVKFLFFAAIIFSLFFIIWAGYKWIMSGGDKQKIEQSRNIIIYAIIGFTIIAISFFIVSIVGDFFGVPLFGS